MYLEGNILGDVNNLKKGLVEILVYRFMNS